MAVEFRRLDERDLPFVNYVESPFKDKACKQALGKEYALNYMIEALLSRGTVFKDYFLASEPNRNNFISAVTDAYWRDKEVSDY